MSEAAKPIRVLLIDDQAVMGTALCLLLSSQSNLQVVGMVADCQEGLAVAASEQPEIILLSDGLTSIDLLPNLLAAAPHARTIVLTDIPDPRLHHHIIGVGAMGLVLKEHTAEVLFKAIERVHAGEVWLERSAIAYVLNEMSHPSKKTNPDDTDIAALTPREREIIALIGEGLKNKQIAARLFLSERTVHHHLASIFHKLGVTDRLELAVFAQRHGLLTSLLITAISTALT
jgi:two-component system, NarL family, nitrate/nitrite response regulator NarL